MPLYWEPFPFITYLDVKNRITVDMTEKKLADAYADASRKTIVFPNMYSRIISRDDRAMRRRGLKKPRWDLEQHDGRKPHFSAACRTGGRQNVL